MLEMIGVIVGVIAGIAGIVGAIVGVLQYLHHRQTTARREAEETAARREAEEEPQPLPQPEWMEQIYLEGKELMGQPNPPGVVGVGNDVLKDDEKTPCRGEPPPAGGRPARGGEDSSGSPHGATTQSRGVS